MHVCSYVQIIVITRASAVKNGFGRNDERFERNTVVLMKLLECVQKEAYRNLARLRYPTKSPYDKPQPHAKQLHQAVQP